MIVLPSSSQVLDIDQRSKIDVSTENALLNPEAWLFQSACHLLMGGHAEDGIELLERELFGLGEEEKDWETISCGVLTLGNVETSYPDTRE